MELAPRFNVTDVRRLAARYSYAQDDEPIEGEIAPRVRNRGYFTKEDFMALCRWKSPRILNHCARNSEELVRDATQIALATKHERLRIISLTALEGVGWPVASVMLHFGHIDRYPILDFRALWSLGVENAPQFYTFDFWWAYVECSRQLSVQADVSMRELDRALWQFSKENS
jgi:hypothetical protein